MATLPITEYRQSHHTDAQRDGITVRFPLSRCRLYNSHRNVKPIYSLYGMLIWAPYCTLKLVKGVHA